MNPLDELAKKTDALERVDDNYPFQRRARILQSLWRIERGFPIHIEPSGKRRGACIERKFAEQSLSNYLTDDIRSVVREEVLGPKRTGKLYGKPRIFYHLLSSQPMVFNLFAALSLDLPLTTKVFAELSRGRCQQVTRIEFEHSPGRRNPEYLGDRSAFDVYIEYMGRTGPGIVGIEVKYHENMDNEDPKDEAKGPNPRYDEVANRAECFIVSKRAQLKEKPLQQVWRDHLLVASILQRDKHSFREGFFAFLSPKANDACNTAIASYQSCLSCCDTFEHWTLEQVVEAIQRVSDDAWVTDFRDRYLGFHKVDDRLSC